LVARPKKERRFYPPCDTCGRTHKGECMAHKEGCYKCGDKGHTQRDCPVATRLGRERAKAARAGKLWIASCYDESKKYNFFYLIVCYDWLVDYGNCMFMIDELC